MSDLASFLFNGTPPAQTTTYGSTTSGVPDWYASYQQGILSAANQNVGQLINAGWNPATGQQVAGLTPDQQAAFQATNLAAGSYQPALGDAVNDTTAIAGGANSPVAAASPLLNQASGMSALSAASPYFGQAQTGFGAGLNANSYGQASPYLQGASALSTTNAAQPALAQAAGLAGQAGATNYLPLAEQYTQQGLSQSGLQAAAPLLNQAASPITGQINDIMQNSFIPQENDALAQQAATNLQNYLMPATNSDFIAAGQYGSGRNQNYDALTTAYAQQQLLAQQAQNLQQGYQSASQTALGQQSNLGALGQIAGNLGSAQQQALLSSGVNLANVGNQATQAQLAASGQLGNVGSTLGNLTAAQQQALLNSGSLAASSSQADTNAQMQAGAGLTGLGQAAGQLTSADQGALTNIANSYGNLTNAGNQTQLTGASNLANQGALAQNLGLQGAQALDLAGQEQQGQTQAQLNASQNNALAQQGFTQDQITYLNSILHGTTPPTSTSTTNQGPANVYSPSPLAQVAGASIGLSQAGKYTT